MRPIIEIQNQINATESRQLELRAIMAESDAHASKCQKLALNFGETYPEELEQYQSANEEWHTNDALLVELYEELEEARKEEEEHPQPQSNE